MASKAPAESKALEIAQPTSINHRLEVHLRFKTFLDSLADDYLDNTDFDSITKLGTADLRTKSNSCSSSLNSHPPVIPKTKDTKNVRNNIFILGSKPNVKHPKKTSTDKKQLRIVLKNISYYLNESKQYCHQCLILFPNIHAMRYHMSKAHSLEHCNSMTKRKEAHTNSVTKSKEENGNAVTKNKDEVSYSVTKTKEILQKSRTKFLCHICTISLSSRSNLARHIKRVHKDRKTNKSNNVIKTRKSSQIKGTKINKTIVSSKSRNTNDKSPILVDSRSKSKAGHACFHCSETFQTRGALIEHLYNVINPDKLVSNSSPEKDKPIENRIDTINNKNDNGDCIIKSNDTSTSKLTNQPELHENNRTKHFINVLPKNKNNNNDSFENNLPESDDHITEDLKLIGGNKNLDKSRHSNIEETICFESDDAAAILNNDGSPDHNMSDNPSDDEPIAARYELKVFNKDNKQLNPKISKAENLETVIKKKHVNVPMPKSKKSDTLIKNRTQMADKKKRMEKLEALTNTKREIYQCYVCGQCFQFYKRYFYHMRVHKVKKTYAVDKTIFESKCKFCSLKFTTLKSHNHHVCKTHREKLRLKIKPDDRAFESILFKCAKCDIFFLSANSARHSEHQDICVDWKCLSCRRLLKMNDKPLHIKQHLLCKNITEYSLCDSALERVLYKCLKCAVHFSENEYCLHSKVCGSEIPDSTYCKTCDVLINKTDMTIHESYHKDNELQLVDFTFIESEIMVNNVKKPEEKKKPTPLPKFMLTFCKSCNCFIGDLSKTRKAHMEKRCDVINPRMCFKCGLILTSRGYVSHKMLHDKVANLSMQTYYFYDIKTNEQILPPIPKYPQCKICEIHFLNKQAIKEHECSQQRYTVCSICKIKLTDAAFKLHINYHTYKLTACDFYTKQMAEYNAEVSVMDTINIDSDSAMNVPAENLVLEVSDSFEDNCLYTCIICDITLDMYDKVIEHCHEHYDYCKRIRTGDYKQIETIDKRDDKSAINIKYDPFYIRFPNDIWIKHIFANVNEEIAKRILDQSIYKYESRFKMEEIQAGPFSLVLYKCDICRCFIEPSALYLHVKSPCGSAKKHSCSTCGLCFSTFNYCRIVHENVHREHPDIKTTSYKIILYNKVEHQQFTKIMIQSRDKFILYRCRNCECVVDKLQRGIHHCQIDQVKKCSDCGLIFREEEFNSHVKKHKEFLYFKPENMTVIIFGKLGPQKENKLSSSFHGTIYDLTFYKCINCGLCLRSKNDVPKHDCVPKTCKAQCPKCYLIFLKKELQEHFQLHENNLILGYDDFNTNIITFDLSTSKGNTDNEVEPESLNGNKNNSKEDANENIMQKIYKCTHCGLHFLEELNARKHYNNCNHKQKIAKQCCFKCNLLFTPGELFGHLLKHHGDKKIRFKYDIINVIQE